jgi:hypothetical protein
MEYASTKFFYAGQRWEVELPICRKCHPIPSVPMHDA